MDQVGNYVLNYYDSQLENSNGEQNVSSNILNSGVQRNDANIDNLLADESNLGYFAETGRFRPVRAHKVCYPAPVYGITCSNRPPKEEAGTIQGQAICSSLYR